MNNLQSEGQGERSVFTGDVMLDAILCFRDLAKQRATVLSRLELPSRRYIIATIHRAENTDDSRQLRRLLDTLNEIASQELPVVFPIHPRTSRLIKDHLSDWQPHQRLRLIEPVGYLDMIALVDNAAVALTDSGGLQKEAFFLGCPCVTLREETEWEETLAHGANRLAGSDPVRIQRALYEVRQRFSNGKADFSVAIRTSFGDGNAAEKICQALMKIPGGEKNKNSRAHGTSMKLSQLVNE